MRYLEIISEAGTKRVIIGGRSAYLEFMEHVVGIGFIAITQHDVFNKGDLVPFLSHKNLIKPIGIFTEYEKEILTVLNQESRK